MGLDRAGREVEVPTEKVTEVRRGKKVTRPQILPRLRARQAGDVRRRLSPGQEHAEGDRLPRLERQAAADLGRRGRAHPQHQGRSRRRRAEDRRSASIMRSATGQGARRPVRQLQRRRRGARFRQAAGSRSRLHLRPRDAGRARVRAGRTGEVSQGFLPPSVPNPFPVIPAKAGMTGGCREGLPVTTMGAASSKRRPLPPPRQAIRLCPVPSGPWPVGAAPTTPPRCRPFGNAFSLGFRLGRRPL